MTFFRTGRGPFLMMLSLLALAACGDDATTSTGSTTGAEGGGGSGQGGGGGSGGNLPTCTTPETTPEDPCGELTIAASPIESRPRNHHLTAIADTKAGPFIYVVGGGDGGSKVLKNVDRYPIMADGSLGPSVEQGPIPVGLAGMTGGVVGSSIVFAGGTRGSTVTDKAYAAVIGDDGTLAPFVEVGTTLQKRMHPASVVKGDEIWVMGGFDDPDVWDDIVRAKVSPDGTVSEWTPAGTLPGPRSHAAVTLVGDDVYMMGGLEESAYSNPPELDDVWHGKLAADGTIGEWTELAPMPAKLATHGSFFYGGWIYVGGGIMDDGTLVPKHEKRIWRAPVQADRTLGAWEESTATFTVKHAHVHQLPIFNHHVYSFAGAVNFDLDSSTTIDIGTFQ